MAKWLCPFHLGGVLNLRIFNLHCVNLLLQRDVYWFFPHLEERGLSEEVDDGDDGQSLCIAPSTQLTLTSIWKQTLIPVINISWLDIHFLSTGWTY